MRLNAANQIHRRVFTLSTILQKMKLFRVQLDVDDEMVSIGSDDLKFACNDGLWSILRDEATCLASWKLSLIFERSAHIHICIALHFVFSCAVHFRMSVDVFVKW